MVLGAVELELWLRVEASTEAMHGVLLFLSGRTYLHERQGDLFRHKGYSRNFLRWGKNTHTHTTAKRIKDSKLEPSGSVFCTDRN